MRKRVLAFVGALTLLVTTMGQATNGSIARAEAPDFFEIYFIHVDQHFRLGTFTFPTPLWLFGDRPGYRCAWGFLMDGGTPVARVQFDRGATYSGIIDQYGTETTNDFSQCITVGDREIKPKPSGLADTIVDLKSGSGTLATLKFPETSGEDSQSWWELEEADANSVEAELYWGEDVAVIATITSLSPSVTFSTRSTGAPAIGSISPTSGGEGTVVDISGANFIGVTSVAFNGVPAATFQTLSSGRILATVPTGATTGPITVTTPSGFGTSGETFTVTAGGPPPPPPPPVTHESHVSLKLSGKLVASGRVSMVDDTTECVPERTVVIKRRIKGKWTPVGTETTDNTGSYRRKLENKHGKYSATVTKVTLANGDVCLKDVSAKRVY